ncbi:MAG: lactate utilization protein B/C [Cytophagales bacterium CG18_big_fil_WC_8_21_14_2_50_42_9]|nr:MAG: lactate utilization protein B/C [Cytophagales bacterium CG18_big_fil_WC_8_21_14_2_50_42_9]
MASSRDQILKAVKQNQPPVTELPVISDYAQPFTDVVQKYIDVLHAIGGQVHPVSSYPEISSILKSAFNGKSIFSSSLEIEEIIEKGINYKNAHAFADLELAVITSSLAVAENGAVWITEDMVQERVLPFIAQHLAFIIRADDIVPTMHEAYEQIGDADYGFGTFIAGPSKTADIEQSLVLGAHGPKSLLVFIIMSK